MRKSVICVAGFVTFSNGALWWRGHVHKPLSCLWNSGMSLMEVAWAEMLRTLLSSYDMIFYRAFRHQLPLQLISPFEILLAKDLCVFWLYKSNVLGGCSKLANNWEAHLEMNYQEWISKPTHMPFNYTNIDLQHILVWTIYYIASKYNFSKLHVIPIILFTQLALIIYIYVALFICA